jgi:hypothetical protein
VSVVTQGEVVERLIPGLGELRFENFAAGEWLTQKGAPAKKSRRRYLLNGEEFDSVSSIVGVIDKPALISWVEKHAAIGAVQAERMGELKDVPEEEYVDRCRALKLGASAARDEGADRGLAVHTAFEAMARTGEPPAMGDYPGAWHPWLRGAVRAWVALDIELIESEEIVCNPEHGYAGRFDLYGKADGERVLVDYKTGKAKVYEQAHYQTRGYAECFEPCGLEPPDRVVIVGVDDAGGFQLVNCEASAEDWYDLLNVHRSRKRISAGMAAQRKALKQATA